MKCCVQYILAYVACNVHFEMRNVQYENMSAMCTVKFCVQLNVLCSVKCCLQCAMCNVLCSNTGNMEWEGQGRDTEGGNS